MSQVWDITASNGVEMNIHVYIHIYLPFSAICALLEPMAQLTLQMSRAYRELLMPTTPPCLHRTNQGDIVSKIHIVIKHNYTLATLSPLSRFPLK